MAVVKNIESDFKKSSNFKMEIRPNESGHLIRRTGFKENSNGIVLGIKDNLPLIQLTYSELL